MAYHDFDKLKAIQITDVLDKLGISLLHGDRALCFMHQDHRPSLKIYKNSNSWFCFTCNVGGGVIELVKEYFKCDKDQACKWLEVEFNFLSRPAGWKWQKKNRPLKTKDKEHGKIDVDSKILEWIIANTNLTPKAIQFLETERKIKKEIYEKLNIRALDSATQIKQKLLLHFGAKRLLDNHIIEEGRFDYKLAWDAPCLLFPFYDYNGKLVNIQSRYLNPIIGDYPHRFSFIKDSKTSLFNAPLLASLSSGDVVLVTEGVTDTLAALSCGINAVAVAGASAFKEEYVDLLCDFLVYICPDNDGPGKNLQNDLKKKMAKRLAVVRDLHLADGSKDIGDYYAKHEELRFG